MLMLSIIDKLFHYFLKLHITARGERATFSSPNENAQAGETVPKFQCQPTLATPLVGGSYFILTSSCFPNPVSTIFLKVAISMSERSFSIRDI